MKCTVCDCSTVDIVECDVCSCRIKEPKRCVICESSVDGSHYLQKYCSDDCRKAGLLHEKSCGNCGKKFLGIKERKFCSHACAVILNGKNRKLVFEYYKENN